MIKSEDIRREGILTGRAQAIKEVIDMANRLGGAVDPGAARGEALATLLSNWMELIHFLDQAAIEAEDEMKLLASQRQVQGRIPS